MKTRQAKVLPSARLNLKDRLSRLTFPEAVKLLGPEGKKLIQENANSWEFQFDDDAYVGDDLFRLSFPETNRHGQRVTVTITLSAEARQRLLFNCNQCDHTCEHLGAALSAILENKSRLGLAEAPPPPRQPIESLDEESLVERAVKR